MFETDRLILTRFRCGSHSLLIEKGRYSDVAREERLCPYGVGVQTILHCFTECPLTRHLIEKEYMNLEEIFLDENVCLILLNICKVLKIPV